MCQGAKAGRAASLLKLPSRPRTPSSAIARRTVENTLSGMGRSAAEQRDQTITGTNANRGDPIPDRRRKARHRPGQSPSHTTPAYGESKVEYSGQILFGLLTAMRLPLPAAGNNGKTTGHLRSHRAILLNVPALLPLIEHPRLGMHTMLFSTPDPANWKHSPWPPGIGLFHGLEQNVARRPGQRAPWIGPDCSGDRRPAGGTTSPPAMTGAGCPLSRPVIIIAPPTCASPELMIPAPPPWLPCSCATPSVRWWWLGARQAGRDGRGWIDHAALLRPNFVASPRVEPPDWAPSCGSGAVTDCAAHPAHPGSGPARRSTPSCVGR